jgi:small-conductance mechanosensitive channel
MSATPTPTPSPETFLGLIDLRLIVLILVVAAAAITIERVINTYLSRFAKRAKLEPHTTNNLMITTRILILLGAIAVIADVGGLPPEWVLSVSAIGGAALGFASQKTIGNFIAGIFLLSAHPFRVGDYVRIGAVEGIVQEITINYTKVFTSANNTVSVSNLQILDRDITNFAYEIEKVGRSPEMYCYTFEVGFDHNVSAQKIGEVFEAVFKNHLLELPKKPAYTLLRSGGTERVYMVYLYVRKPEDIFKFRSQIAEEVYSLWDQERTKPKT